MSALLTTDLCKRFGGILATDHVSLQVKSGSLHALIGPNGAGKTTLISQLSGELAPDSGSVQLEEQEIDRMSRSARVRRGLTRTFQITSIFENLSVLANVAFAVQARVGHSFHFWRDASRDESLLEPGRVLLERVGLARRADVLAASLSHGEQRQLEIAMALATEPRVLLLDEPMAGMGPEESARMVELLSSLKGRVTMLLVEHDMDAVFALADELSVLVNGKLIASGNPESVRVDPDVQNAYLGGG